MAGITLQQAETQLAAYLAAETAVLSGQAYTIGARSLTRANLAEIRDGIDAWNARVVQLSTSGTGRGRSRTVVPAR
jgi:hypothetical protein